MAYAGHVSVEVDAAEGLHRPEVLCDAAQAEQRLLRGVSGITGGLPLLGEAHRGGPARWEALKGSVDPVRGAVSGEASGADL